MTSTSLLASWFCLRRVALTTRLVGDTIPALLDRAKNAFDGPPPSASASAADASIQNPHAFALARMTVLCLVAALIGEWIITPLLLVLSTLLLSTESFLLCSPPPFLLFVQIVSEKSLQTQKPKPCPSGNFLRMTWITLLGLNLLGNAFLRIPLRYPSLESSLPPLPPILSPPQPPLSPPLPPAKTTTMRTI